MTRGGEGQKSYSRRVPIFINIKVMKILDDIFVENIFQSFVPTFLKPNIEAYKLFSFFKTSPRRSDEKKLKRIVENKHVVFGSPVAK